MSQRHCRWARLASGDGSKSTGAKGPLRVSSVFIMKSELFFQEEFKHKIGIDRGFILTRHLKGSGARIFEFGNCP
jgi:hypothetical protein